MVHSIVKSLELESKPLLEYLKYRYLGEQNTLPIIITTGLDSMQEETLLSVLKTHKKDIGWTIIDIKGINPALCQHKIRLEEV